MILLHNLSEIQQRTAVLPKTVSFFFFFKEYKYSIVILPLYKLSMRFLLLILFCASFVAASNLRTVFPLSFPFHSSLSSKMCTVQ